MGATSRAVSDCRKATATSSLRIGAEHPSILLPALGIAENRFCAAGRENSNRCRPSVAHDRRSRSCRLGGQLPHTRYARKKRTDRRPNRRFKGSTSFMALVAEREG